MDDVTRRRVGGYLIGQACFFAALALPDRRAPADGRHRAGQRLARLAGWSFMGAGAGFAFWGMRGLGPQLQASPLPKPGASLRSDGAYGWVRHPIYSGLIVAATGRALTSGGRRHRLAAAGLAMLLNSKAKYEESLLKSTQRGYAAYAERVPRLLPRPRPVADDT